MHRLLDQIVVSKLEESLHFAVEERERLDKIAESGELMPHQQEDWNCLVQDIVAFNRLIKYYGG
jgi:curli biogenesis system outer membrane secretion channel CsgG